MGGLLIILIVVAVGFLALATRQSHQSLQIGGGFTATRISTSGTQHIAIDAPNRKMALANISWGQYEQGMDYVERSHVTVVFGYDEIVSIKACVDKKTELVTLIFTFTKSVPSQNQSKRLVFRSGLGVLKFFERYVPELHLEQLVK